jgi:4'-phosphopantetheinyl transferase
VPRGSDRVEVPPATVHLWWLDVATVHPGEALALLDGAERERHARFRRERDRDRFAGRRALLRRVLGSYTGLAPGDVPIETTPEGRPVCGALEALEFNCSSSGSLAVVALGPQARLGVDLEYRPDGAWEPFPVRRYLAEEEIAALAGLAAAEGIRRAAQAWTLKEAIAKAVGTGLSLPPAEIVLEGDLTRPSVRMLGPWEPYASEHWRAALVESDRTRVAAVAVDGAWEDTVARVWGEPPSAPSA